MRAKDLMRREVLTFKAEDPVDQVVDVLVGNHIHGAPVVNDEGELVGVVSQWDIYFGTMTRRGGAGSAPSAAGSEALTVGDIMTAPAVSAGEDMDIVDLCRMMYKLRIHRVPIVRRGRVTGMVSSLDVCHAVARGELV